jgi:YD repeat-containing protein
VCDTYAAFLRYDGVSRKIKTEFADFPVNPNSFSTITYSGNDTEFTDPFNATVTPQHIQRVNGLGQLTMLCEVSATGFAGDSPSSCGSTISGTGFLTAYSYDPLNNLLSVNQHGISRSFTYDSLSRLTKATNPETGPVTYAYSSSSAPCSPDPSAPCSKTDARGVTTSYKYDALNRVLSKSYSGDPSNSLFSCYQYDLPSSNGIGRLGNAWTQSAACPSAAPTTGFWTKRSFVYDPMGRVTSEKQYTPSNRASGTPYALTYTYDLDGNLLTSTNGTTATPTVGTLTFTNTYDVAEHLQTLTSNWSDATHPASLFSLPTSPALPCGAASLTAPYSAVGGLMNATFGTALSLNRGYDSRFRTTCEIDTGVSSSTGTSGSATVTITGQEQSH